MTATLRDACGRVARDALHATEGGGRQSFRFTADGIADGRYTVEIVARSAGREARASVPIVIDRTLAAFTAAPPVFSPNGDRRLDQLAFRFVLAAPAHVRLGCAERRADPRERPRARPARAALGGTRCGTGATPRCSRRPARSACVRRPTRFAVDTTKPKLRLLSAAARRFSVAEAVTVVGTIGGARVEAKVGPGRFTLSGPPGRIAITAWDAAGNRSRLRHP